MKCTSCRVLLCLSLVTCLGLAGKAQEGTADDHVGRVVDWSYHHIVASGPLSSASLDRASREPRILFHLADRSLSVAPRPSWQQAGSNPKEVRSGPARGGRRPGLPGKKRAALARDWSVSLGAGSVAPNMFPAKFGFNPDATVTAANCTTDYVVFGLNVAGVTSGQANLVGINNLYSGTGGLCGGAPSVNWAYNGTTVSGGKVLTSTVVSLDGTQVAFVESAASSAVFHVLTWKVGEGTSATSAVAPRANGSCSASTSCLKSLTYSASATNTLSSPWVDYTTDKAYVGSDDGKIYRISCVFRCAVNSNPTVDWTFTLPVAGTGGALATPNGPVYDSDTGRLFVGDQLGELWTLNVSVTPPVVFAGPTMIGGGGCTVAHPPGRTGTGTNCTASAVPMGYPTQCCLTVQATRFLPFPAMMAHSRIVLSSSS